MRPSHMVYFTEGFPACLVRLDDFIAFGWNYSICAYSNKPKEIAAKSKTTFAVKQTPLCRLLFYMKLERIAQCH